LAAFYFNHQTADKARKNSVSKIDLTKIERSVNLTPFLTDRAHEQEKKCHLTLNIK
jgi:hypothetical protein